MADARRHAHGHLLLAALPWPSLVKPRHPLDPLWLCQRLLSTSRPSAPQCAAEHHRSHCRPLDLPSLPRAPPLHPRPPHRAARRRMPHNAAFALVFNLGHRRSPLGFRRRQAFPEHAEITVDPAVSSSTEPLSPRRRFPALAPPTIRADSSLPP